MEHPALVRLVEYARKPEEIEKSVSYLTEGLSFLKPKEVVLICFSHKGAESLGCLMEKAVERAGAVPILLDKDWRWKTILKLAFVNRATTIICPPLVALGLFKISKYKQTPLYIRNVVTAGYPCLAWMEEGIRKGFDSKSYGIFTPGGRLVAGFSCGKSWGVHLRDDVYGVDIQDDGGRPAPAGTDGNMIIYPKADPSVWYPLEDRGCLITEPCVCGRTSYRLTDMHPGGQVDPDLLALGQELQSWNSVLDCRLRKSAYGLEIELITFPGEKLPKLPTAAKRIVRPWDPDKDEPFYYVPGSQYRQNS